MSQFALFILFEWAKNNDFCQLTLNYTQLFISSERSFIWIHSKNSYFYDQFFFSHQKRSSLLLYAWHQLNVYFFFLPFQMIFLLHSDRCLSTKRTYSHVIWFLFVNIFYKFFYFLRSSYRRNRNCEQRCLCPTSSPSVASSVSAKNHFYLICEREKCEYFFHKETSKFSLFHFKYAHHFKKIGNKKDTKILIHCTPQMYAYT